MKLRPLRPRTVRAGALFVSFALLLLVYSLRLFQLQVGQHEQWRRRSENNHQSKRVLEMKRGTIYDRHGAELAISVENYTVFLYTREIKSVPETANLLSTVLPMTREEILEKIGTRKGYFAIIKNLERKPATRLMEMKLPGVHLEETFKRVYPQNRLCSNLIGFCGTDGHGLEGLELSFDKSMRGYPGLAVQEDVMMDGAPRRLRVVQPPAGGSNLYLTIDSFVQHLLEGELAKLVKQYRPIDATAIVMDPYTGEILGMACLPNYDLNDFSGSPPDSHRNRSVVDYFEPGSCMKIFAVAAGLAVGKLDADTRFYCRGYSELFGKRIKCHGAHGLVDLAKAISESCNSAMVQIGQTLDPRDLFRMYRELGFGEPTGIDAPAESQGILRPPSRWSGLTGPSISIGQELAVTGIQLVSAYATIANGGELMRPRIVRRLVSQKGDLETEIQPEVRRRVLTPQIAAYLRRLLLGVVEIGTGRQAALPNYTISGKTSTAQKANPKGGYYMDKVVTSFVGFVPALNPKIVMLVAVNEPKGDEKTLFGGKVAGPVFAALADRLMKYLKVPPDKIPPVALSSSAGEFLGTASPAFVPRLLPPVQMASGTKPLATDLPSPPEFRVGSFVPDFRGLPLRQVVGYSRALPVQVIMQGNGVAYEQVPPPGTPLANTPHITVKFSSQNRN